MPEDYRLDHDWYPGVIPGSVVCGEDTFMDSSYCWTEFHSKRDPAVTIGEATGIFDRTAFIMGEKGRINIGGYVELNATFLFCEDRIDIGDHALIAWGCVLTDHWIPTNAPLPARRAMLRAVHADPERKHPTFSDPQPIVIEENVWFGYDCVVLPGTTVGRSSVIGAKVVVSGDIPPYSVVVGNPPRIVKTLDPTDTAEVKREAFARLLGKRSETGENIRGTL